MKNCRDIYQALLDGKRLRHVHWQSNHYIVLDDSGNLVYHNGTPVTLAFTEPEKWVIYEPPRTITLYRYTYIYLDEIRQTDWMNIGWKEWASRTLVNRKLLKTETKEVEIP